MNFNVCVGVKKSGTRKRLTRGGFTKIWLEPELQVKESRTICLREERKPLNVNFRKLRGHL